MTRVRGTEGLVHVVYRRLPGEFLSHCGTYFMKDRTQTSSAPATCVTCISEEGRRGH